MNQETWTVARVLQWTTGYFEEQAFESARLDAELLISDALGVDRVGLYLQHHKPLDPEELTLIRERVRRRVGHEPVAYITGTKGFWTLELKVDARVLVPRPETEHLVERAIDYLSAVETPRVVDVGCGSGCIALSIAEAAPNAEVCGVDISAAALEVAAENAANLDLERVVWQEGDLLESCDGPYDLIVSNPPYIATAEIETLMPSVKSHEPRLALDGGDDGLSLYRRLIPQARSRLAPGGALMVEIGCEQGPAVASLFGEAGLSEVQTHQDYAGHDRVVTGLLSEG